MNIDLEDNERKIIPRWRDFRTTLILGELGAAPGPRSFAPSIDEVDLAEQREGWERHKTLAFATDLVGSAFVLGLSKDLEEAADFILSSASKSSELDKLVALRATGARAIISPSTLADQPTSHEIIEQSKANIRRFRRELSESLLNPIKLVDLSREFATLGSLDKAERTMDIAVSLAPANRFVVRSASRLYVHRRKLEKAHRILKKAPSLRYDPWILAAEIAVASARNLTSRNISSGIELIRDKNISAFDLSEVSSAVATVEMINGKNKRARDYFKMALLMPTDNSVAQAEWAIRANSNLNIQLPSADVPRNFEAPAWEFYTAGDMASALQLGRNWILDQPFAITPIQFAGMVADVTEDFAYAAEVFRFGLAANPDDITLRNNLAFTLASDDRPIAAANEFEKIIKSSQMTVNQRIVLPATEGLIKFRLGFHQEGRALYRKAIEIAKENNSPSMAFRALLYLAREEILARTENGREILEQAEKESKKFVRNTEMDMMLSRLSAFLRKHPAKVIIEKS